VSYSLFDILEVVPSTEPATFGEFLNALADVPTEKSDWRDLFETIRSATDLGLIEVDRDHKTDKINSLQLTADGVATLKDLRNKTRRNK
jgi:hypothetical protein